MSEYVGGAQVSRVQPAVKCHVINELHLKISLKMGKV